MSKATRNNLIAVGVLIALTTAIFILSRFENIAEWWASQYYKEIAYIMLDFEDFFKFSVFEAFMFSLAAATLAFIIVAINRFIHKKKEDGWSYITGMLVMLLAVLFMYASIALPMYKRAPLNIKEEQTLLSDDEAVEIVNKYFDDFNNLVDSMQKNDEGVVCEYSDQELIQKIKDSYKMLDDNEYFARVYARPKAMVFSPIMTWFGIEGITFLPTVEPGYNKQAPITNKVMAIAHELAHTRGIMREADANETAYYVLLNSDDAYLKYIGYLHTYSYMLKVLKLTNNEVDYSLIPLAAKIDIKQSNDFWKQKAVLRNAGEAINSLYLKLNSQDGTNSYQSYDEHTEEEYIDEQGDVKIKYSVTSYSHVQNMIFALYNN